MTRAGAAHREEMIPLRRDDADSFLDVILAPLNTAVPEPLILLLLSEVTAQAQAYQGLRRRLADRVRRLTALYDVMLVAGEPLDLQTMLVRSLARLLTAGRAHVGVIYLLDEAAQRLDLIAQHGLSDDTAAQMQTVPLHSGLAGQVMQRKRPLVVDDIQSDPHTRPVMRQTGLQAYAGVAMRAKGRWLGVLGVFRESKRPFQQEDISLLDSVADQIGVAIENSRLRQQAEQLAVLEERARLARELHDSVTQALYSINLLATAGRRLAQSGDKPALLDETLADLGATAQQALKEMRLLLHRLRPSALQAHDLAGALRQRLEAVERRAGIEARLTVDPLPALPPEVEDALYYIVLEALNNSLKHAAATAVSVYLGQAADGSIVLTVQDNGRGFDPADRLNRTGMGLITMQERAQSYQGALTIESAPGAGTTIRATLKGERHE